MNVDQMLRSDPTELVLTVPPWRVVLAAALRVAALAVPIAYGVYLAVSMYSWFVLVVAAIVLLAKAPFGVAAAVVGLKGPPPALTADGVRLRPSAWRRAVIEVPWSQATMMWIDYVGRTGYLNVVPSGTFGRRFRRPDAPIRPYRIALPPSAGPDVVRSAVWSLSNGTADILDRGYEEDVRTAGGSDLSRLWQHRRASRPPWWQAGLAPLAWAVVVAIGVPMIVHGPPPWNQPWWPGSAVAVTVPDPCRAITATGGTEVGGLPGTSSRSWSSRVCRIVTRTAELTVTYRVHNPFFGDSVAAAREDADDARFEADTDTAVEGLGDEAWIGAASYGSGRSAAGQHVVARRANVVVEVRFLTRDEEDAVRNVVTGTARAALDRLSVR